MASQEDMEKYLEDAEENLNGIEDDIEAYFSEMETRENPFSEQADSDVISAYEWVPRTETSSARERARKKYEQWYNAVEPVMYEYQPRRYEDFEESHSKITSYIELNTSVWEKTPENPMEWAVQVIELLNSQKSIVNATPNRAAAEQLQSRREISADVEADELIRAKELFDGGLVRESGVIAGVALERHLLTLCETSDRNIDYDAGHGIGRLAQSLYEADEIRNPPMKHLKHLGSLRDDCAHPGEEPDQQDVERLVNDTEDFIRGRTGN